MNHSPQEQRHWDQKLNRQTQQQNSYVSFIHEQPDSYYLETQHKTQQQTAQLYQEPEPQNFLFQNNTNHAPIQHHTNHAPIQHHTNHAPIQHHTNHAPMFKTEQQGIYKPQPDRNQQLQEHCQNNPEPKRKQLHPNHQDPHIQTQRQKEQLRLEAKRLRERESYHKNPESKRLRERERYHKNLEAKRLQQRERYQQNSEAKRLQQRERYHQNSEAKRLQQRERYHQNSEAKRLQQQECCQQNAATKRLWERESYKHDPKPKRLRECETYKHHAEPKRNSEKSKHAENPALQTTAKKRLYHQNLNKKNICYKVKQLVNTYKRKNILRLQRQKQYYITRLVRSLKGRSHASKLMTATYLVDLSIEVSLKMQNNLQRQFTALQSSTCVFLKQIQAQDNVSQQAEMICGPSQHTSHTEAYFWEGTYNSTVLSCIPIDEKGQCHIFPDVPLKKDKKHAQPQPLSQEDNSEEHGQPKENQSTHKWQCHKNICQIDLSTALVPCVLDILESIVSEDPKHARTFMDTFDDCANEAFHSSNKAGHPISCYMYRSTCKSSLRYLRTLGCHFPRVRKLVHNIYSVVTVYRQITSLQKALEDGDEHTMTELCKPYLNTPDVHPQEHPEFLLSDASILTKYHAQFLTYTQLSADTPKHACASCDKLCHRRECVQIATMQTTPDNDKWLNLMVYLDRTNTPAQYVCHYCLQKFRTNKLPPRCVLNQMAVPRIPTEISCLNDYEKILIQRGKAFQTVSRISPVSSSKRLPHQQRVQKMHGRTFHLPLPLQETLSKLPPPNQALPDDMELHILVCGAPTKSKTVLEDIVDLNKVYNALQKLKEINPFYKDISLPQNSVNLLSNHNLNVFQCHSDNEDQGEDEITVKATTKEQPHPKEPLLCKVEPEEEAVIYRNYTIHPIHSERKKGTATALYQMLHIQDDALEDWEKKLDLLCFPDLYTHGIHGMHAERMPRLNPTEFVKARLQSCHAQFRLNQQYIFHLQHEANLRQINGGFYHKLKMHHPQERMTAARWLQQMSNDNLESDLTTIYSRLKNTPQYWRKPRNNVDAMTQAYGAATWFVTLSPAEWTWTDLGQYIKEVNGPGFANLPISELVAQDPVSASRFMHNKFLAILNFITSPNGPLGKVTHYFWRREYQGRGMQHFHMLLWVEDAPLIGVSPNSQIAKYIHEHVTCAIPNDLIAPVLRDRVLKWQQHKCNKYCLRSKKTPNKVVTVCRFGFPRKEQTMVVIRDVAEAIAGRKGLNPHSRLYDLPRSSTEVRTNDYNPAILLAWEGNMDIQFIGEQSTALNRCITKYLSKPEKSYPFSIMNDINSNKSLTSRLWNVVLRSLSNRECGALEAADNLLGLPLYGTDPQTTIKWIDVSKVSSRRLKSKENIDMLAKESPDSTDIYFPSWIDSYYPKRPEALQDMSLYDFIAWHDVVTEKPKNENIPCYMFPFGYIKKRRIPYLINHYHYSVQDCPEDYFYAILLLFKPWKDRRDILSEGCHSYVEAFRACKDNLQKAMAYHDQLQQIAAADEEVTRLVEKKQKEIEAEEDNDILTEEPENPVCFAPLQAAEAVAEFRDVAAQPLLQNVQDMLTRLNKDQQRVFDHIAKTLQQQTETNASILRMFVSGTGGTGKTFLIQTVAAWVRQSLGKEVAITAPTGVAAHNINGMTIRRLLMLPVEHGKTPVYRNLSDEVLQCLRTDMRDVTLLIIDEVSMITNVTLLYIHLRLCEIFQTANTDDGWFGKINILLLGDLLQLPPVHENPPYVPVTQEELHKLTGSMGSVDLWNLFAYDELTINMRQKQDRTFENLLNRARLGATNQADHRLLTSHLIPMERGDLSSYKKQIIKHMKDLDAKDPSSTCIMPTVDACNQIQTAILDSMPGEDIHLMAIDTVDCPRNFRRNVLKKMNACKADCSRAAGLETIIRVKIGCKLMLRKNIDIATGLINGAIGKLQAVSYHLENTSMVKTITIKFNNGVTHTFERMRSKFEIMDRVYIVREQFPVVGAHAITIHKCQGMTLNTVMMDLGNSIFSCGQSFVALSRVTSLSGVHLINFDPTCIKALQTAVVEYNRLRGIYWPTLISMKETNTHKGQKVKDRVHFIHQSITHVQEQQKPQSSKRTLAVTHPFRGLSNPNFTSCYANATLQCLLHLQPLKDSLKHSQHEPIRNFVRNYDHLPPTASLTTVDICHFLGEPFNRGEQQDVAKFLTKLSHVCPEVSRMVSVTISHDILCTRCRYRSSNREVLHVYPLHIPAGTDFMCLEELIHRNNKWAMIPGSKCRQCNTSPIMKRQLIQSAGRMIAVQLMFWETKPDGTVTKRHDAKFTAVHKSKINVDDRNYQLSSIIIHQGQGVDSGHYVSVLAVGATGKWVHANDTLIEVKSWPRNAKDMYMAFYEEI
ncbi:uncharacterized protein LOC117970172 isoform X1 [Acipenser ruthenus]|uniref:uncharacterized protein LOC117970172 isoform X1 n=1 Tax=Acipenser ruthenus TaxID=7906 RepID=UPI002741EE50|nr:uncharacterized protein LOC117970172 isoform X1 [Acipenser ruthenus]